MNTPSHKPKCPNHGVALEGCGFPLPKKGVGRCPISGAPFEFEVEVDENPNNMVKDKFGNIIKQIGWKVKGND